MREKVVIVGGGVAGLSAAHELAERGFEVHVYERRPFFGGKAASYPVPSGEKDKDRPPGEHGFRFFPGWYRHLTHTMSRIPYHRPGGGRRTVAENLVSVRTNLLAFFDRAPIALPLQVPTSIAQASILWQFITEFSRLGLTSSEVAGFLYKLKEFVTASDQKLEETLESTTWWDYLECDKPGRSRAYVDLARATTRTSVAAKAEQVSAYTIGRLVVRTLLDTMSSVDRVLNGPTNDVWIDPWVLYLQGRGVKFHPNMELSQLVFDSASRNVKHLHMQPVLVSHLRRLRKRLNERTSSRRGAELDLEPLKSAVKTLKQAFGALESEKLRAKLYECYDLEPPAPGADASFDVPADGDLPRCEEIKHEIEKLEAVAAELEQENLVSANYFVLALPLEQLAYYVNRTTMLGFLAPELRNVVRLQREMDWMAGVQFFFRVPLDIAPGHLVGVDSDWALTAIEQTQFWDDVDLPDGVKAILSVDISAWNKKGRKIRKEAFHCTPQEIAEEVWAQLSEMLNKSNRAPVLSEHMLLGGKLKQNVSFHLDESLVERTDRKKQAFYERSRSLSFGLVGDLAEPTDPGDKLEEGFMWGERNLLNAEPLLINHASTRKLRPEAQTSIPNLFLAGDYVRTETDLACMEGANEAARRAVNGILERSASREPPCELWPFSPSRHAIEGAMGLLAPAQAVRNVANVVSSLPGKLWKSFGGRE